VLLSEIGQKLKELGVETLGVVATSPERTRLFFKYRPPRIRVGADPGLVTHKAYGLPNLPHTPEIDAALHPAAYRELNGEVPVDKALEVLDRLDGYTSTPADLADSERHQAQIEGQFLVDRGGIVRWANIEGEHDGLDGVGKIPSAAEFLAQARQLVAPQ